YNTRDKTISDYIGRRYLFDKGLNYAHGTGHGVGVFSNVHEGPLGIGTSTRVEDGIILEEGNLLPDCSRCLNNYFVVILGMFTSIEPGYYHAGEFGIRIENIVMVAK